MTALPSELVERWSRESRDEVAEVIGRGRQAAIAPWPVWRIEQAGCPTKWVGEQGGNGFAPPGGHWVKVEAGGLAALK